MLKNLILEKKNDNKFFLRTINLKDNNLRKEIFDEVIAYNKKIVLFISDPFDIKTIVEIVEYFRNTKHYIVAINIKDYKELLITHNKLNVKEFKDEARHVMLLGQKNQ